ncbi:MAG: type II secretion system protein [Candidatus Levybacteria bacterium]|nr:type II secretion system protein [Candidatus Levybacteria bacterium]
MIKISNLKSQISNILRIGNWKLEIGNSRVKREEGFTLVELLSVIMIVTVVGGIIGAILISTLTGTNKTNSLENVRQNGNYALLQVSKTIEFSRNFYGVSTDGINYITDCTQLPVSPTPTPVQYANIKIMSDNGQNVVFSCNLGDISSNSASLIDTNTVTASSCFFTCSQESIVQPPTIGINFTLAGARAGNFVENKTSVPFSTTVTLRNLKISTN